MAADAGGWLAMRAAVVAGMPAALPRPPGLSCSIAAAAATAIGQGNHTPIRICNLVSAPKSARSLGRSGKGCRVGQEKRAWISSCAEARLQQAKRQTRRRTGMAGQLH